MKRQRRMYQIISACAVVSLLLLTIGCSNEPAPGPMSPLNPEDKRALAEPKENGTAAGEIRPVARQNPARALAKVTTYDVKAMLHLQDLVDELQYIVTNKPGTAAADKIEDVVAKVVSAQNELKKTPPDKSAALGNLAGAKGDLQAAIKDKLLNSTQGNQFLNEIKAIEAIIKTGGQVDHDCRGTSKFLWMKRSEGGLIAHCGHQIIVPANALSNDATMSISVDKSSYITVDCGPDGWFNKPVTVVISYRDGDLTSIDLNKLTLAWHDTNLNKWIDLGGNVDTIRKIVKVVTWHFTQYTISMK